MLQGFFRDSSKILQRFFRDAPEMLQRCSKDSSKMLQRCSRDAPEMLQRCSRDLTTFLNIFKTIILGDSWRFLEILGDSWRFLEILLEVGYKNQTKQKWNLNGKSGCRCGPCGPWPVNDMVCDPAPERDPPRPARDPPRLSIADSIWRTDPSNSKSLSSFRALENKRQTQNIQISLVYTHTHTHTHKRILPTPSRGSFINASFNTCFSVIEGSFQILCRTGHFGIISRIFIDIPTDCPKDSPGFSRILQDFFPYWRPNLIRWGGKSRF